MSELVLRDEPELPDPEQGRTNWQQAVVIAREARAWIAERGELELAKELRRRLAAYEKYVTDREGQQAIKAESRFAEVLIGKLLGPAVNGRPTENVSPRYDSMRRNDRVDFRRLAQNEAEVERQVDAGTVDRKAILRQIERRGWEVFDFGQATQPFQLFAHLRLLPVALRWRPDRIVRRPGTQLAALVDAKGTTEKNRGSSYYTMECDSLTSLVGHGTANGLECYVVFHDFKVATAQALAAIVENGEVGSSQGGGVGSGTPYWLIPKRYVHETVDSVFGWPT